MRIDTKRLLVQGGAQISSSTLSEGIGKGGNLHINASESVELIGRSVDGQASSGVFSQAGRTASKDAGDLRIDTGRLLVRDGARISTDTAGEGKGGNLEINASDEIELIGRSADGRLPSGVFSQSFGSRDAGDLKIGTGRLLIRGGAAISSASVGDGTAGDINITARDTLRLEGGDILTIARRFAGGDITIKAAKIRLFGNSDIRSDVASGADNGGAITLTAGSVLVFDDSDILAFAQNGTGGNITLNTPAFFGENYRPAPRGTDSLTLDNNNRVDLNATGAISGIITIPDVSFIQNSLNELPDNQINTDTLLANSCIARRSQPTQGSFTITGAGGFPRRPSEAQMSNFPTVDIETLPSDSKPSTTRRAWQKGDPIAEPQGVYRLPNGKIVLSQNCP